jgi:hypothetical protein|tara:strand:+ start:231 stop:791 length:561 start_codon:yes stop_codon:yes gene_type:complete
MGTITVTRKRLEKGLEYYLECEKLLNDFFSQIDFCLSQCISQPIGKYRVRMDMPGDPTQFQGNVGCCPYSQFNDSNHSTITDMSLLENRRLEKYGKPHEDSSACGYHNSEGCALKDHKSPICLAYVCPEFAYQVHEKYGIRYSQDKIEHDLELILTGNQSSEDIRKFQDKIEGFINKIKKIKGKYV